MLHRAMLHPTVPSHAVLDHTVPHPTVPSHAVLHHVVLHRLVPFHATLCHIEPRHAVPCHAVPCCAVLCRAALHCAAPCCATAVLQEAVSTRDLELVQLVLRYRDYQRAIKRLAGIPILLEKLRKVPGAGGALGVGGITSGPLPTPLLLAGPGLLCGDEVGVHQLG